MKHIFIIALSAIALTACNKDEPGDGHDHDHGENDPIMITFNTPNENESFDFNEVVTAEGWIMRASNVHGYTVELLNQSNQDSVLYTHEVHDHGNELHFNDTWTNDLSDTSTVMIRIVAFGDHEANTSETATCIVTCNGQ